MAKGFSESILHTAGIRLRVVGNGVLRCFLKGYDGIQNYTLATINLNSVTSIQPTILANFKSQRTQLEIKVTAIDEYFVISKLVIYSKPVSTGYPQ